MVLTVSKEISYSPQFNTQQLEPMLSSYIKRARLKLRANTFSNRVINPWNSLPVIIVEAPFLAALKSRSNNHWKNHLTKFDAGCYRAGPSEG